MFEMGKGDWGRGTGAERSRRGGSRRWKCFGSGGVVGGYGGGAGL